jgi:hypothetical protein
MSLFRSTRTQARVVFALLTGLAVAVSLVLLYIAPRFGPLATEVAIVPLFLTAWIGAGTYRRRYGGRLWQPRVAIVMAASGALGGILALATMMSWTEWPSLGNIAFWSAALVVGSVLFGASTVPLMWLSDRRLLRIKIKRRHHTSGSHPPKDGL